MLSSRVHLGAYSSKSAVPTNSESSWEDSRSDNEREDSGGGSKASKVVARLLVTKYRYKYFSYSQFQCCLPNETLKFVYLWHRRLLSFALWLFRWKAAQQHQRFCDNKTSKANHNWNQQRPRLLTLADKRRWRRMESVFKQVT